MLDIQTWLNIAVEKKASDLHLSSGLVPILRIDGDLIPISETVLEKNALYQALKSLISGKNDEQFLQELEYDFSFSIKGLARFRVNCFHQVRGPSAVFRIISENIPSLEDVKAPAVLQNLCHLPYGLILITGPTGSGKSTTMAAMVEYMNSHFNKNILTIESPIEFMFTPKNCIIQQREVGEHTLDYQRALRAALREDPNVIVVGEMRDHESIRLALTAAETGHLVISTLHTNSAVETIDRIINVFPPQEQHFVRNMLSRSLQAIISQTLLKKKEGGRVASFEILVANTATRSLIREDKLHQLNTIIQTSQSEGMMTREQSIQQLMSQGIKLA